MVREPWLARWQDVVCLTIASTFVALLIIFGGDVLGVVMAKPYVAVGVLVVAFIATWVFLDFVIALLITHAERRREEAQRNPPRPRHEKPPPPPVTRAPLPRAIARLRARFR